MDIPWLRGRSGAIPEFQALHVELGLFLGSGVVASDLKMGKGFGSVGVSFFGQLHTTFSRINYLDIVSGFFFRSQKETGLKK